MGLKQQFITWTQPHFMIRVEYKLIFILETTLLHNMSKLSRMVSLFFHFQIDVVILSIVGVCDTGLV